VPAQPKPWTHHRARVASLTARGASANEIDKARRDLRAERLADYIKRTVDVSPPLTPEQRQRLAGLLRGPGEAA
jgi:hypothetical protein